MANEIAGRLSRFDFTPATFTPVQYTPQVSDSKEITTTLEKQQAMVQNANQTRANLSDNLNKFRALLNPSEQAAFDTRISGIKKTVDDEIRVGNYGSAMKYAQQQGIALADDVGLQNKIQANQQYQEARKALQSNPRINDRSLRLWDIMNPYADDGTGTWKAGFNLVDDIEDAQVFATAEQMTPVDQQSKSSQSTVAGDTLVDANGNVTTDYSNAVGTKYSESRSSQSSRTVSSKSYERLTKTLKDLIKTPQYRQAMMQQYLGIYYDYDRYEKIANDPSYSEEQRNQARAMMETLKPQIFDKNGAIINTGKPEDFDKWVDTVKVPFMMNMKFQNVSTSTGSSYSRSYDFKNQKGAAGGLTDGSVGDSGNVEAKKGPNVNVGESQNGEDYTDAKGATDTFGG